MSFKRSSVAQAIFLFGVFIASCVGTPPTSPSAKINKPFPGRSLVLQDFTYSKGQGTPPADFKTQDYVDFIPQACYDCGAENMFLTMKFPGAPLPNEYTATENSEQLSATDYHGYHYGLVATEVGASEEGYVITTKIRFYFSFNYAETLGTSGIYNWISGDSGYVYLQSDDGIHFTPYSSSVGALGYRYDFHRQGNTCNYDLIEPYTQGEIILDPYEKQIHIDLFFQAPIEASVGGFYGQDRTCPLDTSSGEEGSWSLKTDINIRFKQDGPVPTPLPEDDSSESCLQTTLPNGRVVENCFACPPGQNIVFQGGEPVGCDGGISTDNTSFPFGENGPFRIQSFDAQNNCVVGGQ